MRRRCCCCCCRGGRSSRSLSPMLWLFWCFLSGALVPGARSHPQCLDFKPPFRPMRELQFCAMYKDFGCCEQQRDQELMAEYYRIMDRFDSAAFESCAGYVLDLLCQVGTAGTHARARASAHEDKDRATSRTNTVIVTELETCCHPAVTFGPRGVLPQN